MKNSRGVFTKLYPQPPHPVWIFPEIAHSRVCLHHGAADRLNKISKQFWKIAYLAS